jgi:hypothetical protein
MAGKRGRYGLIVASLAFSGCSPDERGSLGYCDNMKTGERVTLVGRNLSYWFLRDAKGRNFTVEPTGDWRCAETNSG